MLLSRYSNIEFVLELPIKEGIPLIEKCQEQYQEERIWQMYLAILPNMDEKSYVNFNDYKKNILNPQKYEQQKQESIQKVQQHAEATTRKSGEIDPQLLAMANRYKAADLKSRTTQ